MPLFLHLTIFIILFGSHDGASTKKIIIDTDAGSDDGVAIALALGVEKLRQNITIMGFTAVSGNTNVDNVGRNLLKILDTAKRLDIQIYKGLNDSILYTPENDNFYGNDGFGDFPFPDPPSEDLINETHAVNFLTSAVRENPGEITLICIGPLSNVAMAIRMDPTFFNNLAAVVILGGSVKGQGNVKPGVEFNIYIDPEAASIVLQAAVDRVKSGWSPVKLVSWETSLAASIDWNWRRNVLGGLGSAMIDLLNKAEHYSDGLEEKWVYSDSVAVAVAIDDVPKQETLLFATSETCGTFGRGAFFIDYSNGMNATKQLSLISDVDVEYMKTLLLTSLNV